ncbi:MAG TPA: LysR family transcriptional regulator [Kofleriaceae bacterium]|nr:LysR family transcriptional regulator [Kofleriaceae bacterium]
MRDVGLAEIEAVIAVSQRRSFRAAAAELGMSRTALSAAVAGLEARLGVRLFNRTTRSVSPTEAGVQFIADVSPALAQIREAMEGVNAHRTTPAGTLRLNSSLGAATRLLRPLFAEYLRRYPAVHVEIAADDRFVDIVAGGFDAGIRLAEDVPRDMIAVPLGVPVHWVIVGSPELIARHGRPKHPRDLSAIPCVGFRHASGAVYRWELQQGKRKVTVDATGSLTVDAVPLMRDAALAGLGLAYLADLSVDDDVRGGRLVRVLADWMPPPSALALYYPGRRHVPAALARLVEIAREKRRPG